MPQFRWIALFVLAATAARADTPQPNASFYLINKGTIPIDRVFATAVGQDNWGRDRLTSASIQPGGNFAVRLPADGKCVYDVRVTYAGGRNEEKRSVDTCKLDSLTFPGGRITASARAPATPTTGPTFTVVNRSGGALNELYLSTSGDDSWGDDRLGDDTLPAGGSKAIRLPAGDCLYDIRVVFANGDANEKRRLNVCQTPSIRLP